jgi:biotin-[acetyl-CoA-carboxylase] ligase BirA-like protein
MRKAFEKISSEIIINPILRLRNKLINNLGFSTTFLPKFSNSIMKEKSQFKKRLSTFSFSNQINNSNKDKISTDCFEALSIGKDVECRKENMIYINKEITIFHFNKIDSSHKLALNWPNNSLTLNKIFVFRADSQSSGVGQRTNSWNSPEGNLYITFLFICSKDFNVSLLPQTAALSLKKALDSFTSNEIIKLKWINDLFYKEKKLAGVLVNSSSINEEKIKLIVSMGVNLNISPIETSTCLRDVIGQEVDVLSFSNLLIKHFLVYAEELLFKKNDDFVLIDLNSKLMFIHEDVCIWNETLDEVIEEGVFLGINPYGNAIIKVEGSEQPKIISSGRMRKKPPINNS